MGGHPGSPISSSELNQSTTFARNFLVEIGERQDCDQGSFSEIREHNSVFVRGSEDVVIALVLFRETRFGVSGDREEEPEERDHPHGTHTLIESEQSDMSSLFLG